MSKAKSKHADASPAKSLRKELSAFQADFRATFRAYEGKLAKDLSCVREWSAKVAKVAEPSREQIRTMGDMLGLLKKLKLKPEKGRRRDLRKVDGLIEDLVFLSKENSKE